jgi:hypothetical protein
MTAFVCVSVRRNLALSRGVSSSTPSVEKVHQEKIMETILSCSTVSKVKVFKGGLICICSLTVF